ncbi:hypothetical protein DAEQUDRAFT_602096 [Daedalea quercina L-15889]|uniref:Uncharacterized protein n=1 Tax=Daedalea quercina L-15889 TaxID=1314783 RepID=A0A165LN16_9APHY|nr:hypothetical protein DAEQUDRAFT_602096 [Daedalea quercina L-15889]
MHPYASHDIHVSPRPLLFTPHSQTHYEHVQVKLPSLAAHGAISEHRLALRPLAATLITRDCASQRTLAGGLRPETPGIPAVGSSTVARMFRHRVKCARPHILVCVVASSVPATPWPCRDRLGSYTVPLLLQVRNHEVRAASAAARSRLRPAPHCRRRGLDVTKLEARSSASGLSGPGGAVSFHRQNNHGWQAVGA